MKLLRAHSSLAYLYTVNLFFAIHVFLVSYMGSNFLLVFLPERAVGLVYAAGALIGLVAFGTIPFFLRRYNSKTLLLTLVALEALVFLGLAFSSHSEASLLLFIAYLVIYPLGFYCLDVLLERLTKAEQMTGTLRGVMLTTMNVGLIIAPLLSGVLLVHDRYRNVFLAGALLLIPVSLLIALRLPATTAVKTVYGVEPFLTSLTCVSKSPNIRRILFLHLLLHIFFSFMVIYVPLYLHGHLGFSWPQVGLVLASALLPYVLIEFPAGRIADKYIGEKELLILGFIVACAATVTMAYTNRTDVFFWAGLLFMTRVGAALIESMSETYFFKKVNADDTHTISFFRMIQPVSYLVGPVIGTLVLLAGGEFETLFLVLAGLLAIGIPIGNQLIDTK